MNRSREAINLLLPHRRPPKPARSLESASLKGSAYPNASRRRSPSVNDLWLQDLESLEEMSQDTETREIFLRMAELQREGRIGNFLTERAREPGLDETTKGTLAELAQDGDFLLAVEDYVRRTEHLH